MPEQSKDRLSPDFVPIPDEVREFLEAFHILVKDLESGTCKWGPGNDYLVGDLIWNGYVASGPGMVVYPDSSLAEFDCGYAPHSDGITKWEFELSREEVAGIANGTVNHLSLYCCANPLCGYKSSCQHERCPRCHLPPGREIGAAHAEQILGLCPYCHKLLRTLYARQCHHCLMDWHDPDHPTKLGAKS